MKLPHNFGSILMESRPDNITDIANEYGEPGYSTDGPIVLGDYWCRCDRIEGLHDMFAHYPRVAQQMEDEGWATEWYDEWVVSYEGSSRCWRTTGDSYSWQSSILWCDGDFLTPDDGIDAWIDEVVDNPHRCLPSHVWSDQELIAEGWSEYRCGYESGWHPGQTDDPEKITELIRAELGDSIHVLFKLQGVGQFDIQFCVFVKEDDDDEG